MPEKPITIQARHDFTDDEWRRLAETLLDKSAEYGRVESELSSIKKDYNARLERIDLDRASVEEKMRNKFEMRETLALVALNVPTVGRKSFFQAVMTESVEGYAAGNFISESEMTWDERNPKLPLEEPKPAPEPSNEDLAGSFDSAAAPQSKDVPPVGFIFVTGGVSREGDACWCEVKLEWQIVETEGVGLTADAFTALARKIGAPAEPDPAPENPTAGMTPFAQALAAAAAGKPLPLVPVKLSKDFPPSKNLMQFRKAARKIGWGEAALDLIDEEAGKVIYPSDDDESNVRLFALLNPHCVEGAK